MLSICLILVPARMRAGVQPPSGRVRAGADSTTSAKTAAGGGLSLRASPFAASVQEPSGNCMATAERDHDVRASPLNAQAQRVVAGVGF